eukprot:CAMPEP_0114345014 /NCGR_PEP_ID=MMETSP0101-20121206/11875_1 /TAXON_ID=38822 ORGANISM="Pteridomonas danica, Strain PT" /NCGR_SAMPLE_ID=MMETSP0101 /ASSEMBLY_ACC=CAM_ASM_000211 /LENGTH=39 /DNA_ID= /DNA_START= /DNA_END= /DNA_ORIENTATION=
MPIGILGGIPGIIPGIIIPPPIAGMPIGIPWFCCMNPAT